MNSRVLIVVLAMLGSTLQAETDKYMTEALGFPDLISLSLVGQHHKAVRALRVVDASSWGFHATDLIETKTGFLMIDRRFSYRAPSYEGRTRARTFPLGTKDLAAVGWSIMGNFISVDLLGVRRSVHVRPKPAPHA